MDVIFRIDGGRLFHSCGAVTANKRTPYAKCVCMAGTRGGCLSVNGVPVMAGMDVAILLGRYKSGAKPLSDL